MITHRRRPLLTERLARHREARRADLDKDGDVLYIRFGGVQHRNSCPVILPHRRKENGNPVVTVEQRMRSIRFIIATP